MCPTCDYAKRHAHWPTPGTHCPGCHRTWTSRSQAHCAGCHEQFSTANGFDLHFPRCVSRHGVSETGEVEYPGMVRDEGGVWRRPAPTP